MADSTAKTRPTDGKENSLSFRNGNNVPPNLDRISTARKPQSERNTIANESRSSVESNGRPRGIKNTSITPIKLFSEEEYYANHERSSFTSNSHKPPVNRPQSTMHSNVSPRKPLHPNPSFYANPVTPEGLSKKSIAMKK